jgi:hypothetical protein
MTQRGMFDNVSFMKADFDVLFVATRLVEEMGDAAARISRVNLVEQTAANRLAAADFWRQVLGACETLLARRAETAAGGGAVKEREASVAETIVAAG